MSLLWAIIMTGNKNFFCDIISLHLVKLSLMKVAEKSGKKFNNPGFIGLLGGKDLVSRPIHSDFDLILLSNEGITKQSLESLISYLGISKKAFSENILDASVKTLERKKNTDRLGKLTSSLAIEIAKVVEHALEVFEDEEKVKTWLNSPIRALNYQKPIEFFSLPTGLKMVDNVLTRIEYGVYS
jgi:putative toxin-antitoxin system antitoxin component (TIGR02293 family)